MRNFRIFISGMLTMALILALAITVFAAPIDKVITVVYNNIKIYVDGNRIDPKDANGNIVEPFIYNGTTYLPVRAIGEALGKDVSWDGDTQTVFLDTPAVLPPPRPRVTYMFDVVKAFEIGLSANSWVRENVSFKMLGDTYDKGITFKEGTWGYCGARYNLRSQYKTIKGVIGHVDGGFSVDGTFSIRLDDNPYREYEITRNMLPKEIVIDVTDVLIIEFAFFNSSGKANNETVCGFGNVTIE